MHQREESAPFLSVLPGGSAKRAVHATTTTSALFVNRERQRFPSESLGRAAQGLRALPRGAPHSPPLFTLRKHS